MARIRTVKPELFVSTSRAAVSVEARFLFVGILTQMDDEGRGIDSPKTLAGALFPFDEHIGAPEVRGWTDELVAFGALRRYSVGGADYIHLPNWEAHQHISKKTPSKHPAPPARRRSSRKSPGKSAES